MANSIVLTVAPDVQSPPVVSLLALMLLIASRRLHFPSPDMVSSLDVLTVMTVCAPGVRGVQAIASTEVAALTPARTRMALKVVRANAARLSDTRAMAITLRTAVAALRSHREGFVLNIG